MNHKETILKNIEKNKPAHKPLPGNFVSKAGGSPAEHGNLIKTNLAKAGAEIVEIKNSSEVSSYLKTNHEGMVDFRNRAIWKKYQSDQAKMDLEHIHTAVIEGQFGVAENGAIWVTDSDFPHRLVPFIHQEFIIILNKSQIVDNMHEAYRKIKLEEVGFGVFISGPSKTADIEQSLVYGAHGPKKLTVVLINQD